MFRKYARNYQVVRYLFSIHRSILLREVSGFSNNDDTIAKGASKISFNTETLSFKLSHLTVKTSESLIKGCIKKAK